MTVEDEDRCQRCGEPAEGGFVRWNDGYALRWQPRGREKRWRRRDVLVGPSSWGMPVRKVAANRCLSCRLVWFRF